MKRQILDVIFCSVRFSLLGFFLESLILSRISNSCGDRKDLSNVYSDSFNSISASIIFPDFTFQPENCTRIVSAVPQSIQQTHKAKSYCLKQYEHSSVLQNYKQSTYCLIQKGSRKVKKDSLIGAQKMPLHLKNSNGTVNWLRVILQEKAPIEFDQKLLNYPKCFLTVISRNDSQFL